MVDTSSGTTGHTESTAPSAEGEPSAPRRWIRHASGWAQGVWQSASAARGPVLALCLLGALALLVALLPQTWLALGPWASLGARPAALLESLTTTSEAAARLLRLLLGLLVVLAGMQFVALAVPGWSLPPLGRLFRWQFGLPWPSGQARARVDAAMAVSGLGLAWRPGRGAAGYAAARRLGVRGWLVAALPLGFLVLVAALWVRLALGWSGAAQDLAVGDERYLDPDRRLSVFLDELAIVPDEEGSLRSLSARLLITRDGGVPVGLALESGGRAVIGDIALYGLGYGPAVRVQAQTTDGQRLELRPLLGDSRRARVMRVVFDDEQQERWLAIPERSLLVRMLYYAQPPHGGGDGPRVHAQVIRGRDGEVLADLFLEQGQSVELEDLVIDIAFEYFLNVQAQKELHLPIAVAGAALVALGLLAWLVWPPREAWVVVYELEEGDTQGRLSVRARQAQTEWFGCVQALLSEELASKER